MMLREESMEDLRRRLGWQQDHLDEMARQCLEHFRIQAVLVSALLDSAQAGERRGGVFLAAGATQIQEAMELVETTLPAQLDYEDLVEVGRGAALAMAGAYKEHAAGRRGPGYQARKAQMERERAGKQVDWLQQGWKVLNTALELKLTAGEDRIEVWRLGGHKADDLGELLESDAALAHERMQLVRLQGHLAEKAQEEDAPSL
jgi:hypothetical protein